MYFTTVFLKEEGKKMLTRACRLLWFYVAVPSLREARRAVWTNDCYVRKPGAAGPLSGPQSVSTSTFRADWGQSASSRVGPEAQRVWEWLRSPEPELVLS